MNYTPTYNSVNRQGFPLQIGVDRTTTPYTYKTISIGVLDDNHTAGGLERKASYSNMGNAVDFYTIGDASIGAKGGGSSTSYSRNDSSYRIDSNYNIV